MSPFSAQFRSDPVSPVNFKIILPGCTATIDNICSGKRPDLSQICRPLTCTDSEKNIYVSPKSSGDMTVVAEFSGASTRSYSVNINGLPLCANDVCPFVGGSTPQVQLPTVPIVCKNSPSPPPCLPAQKLIEFNFAQPVNFQISIPGCSKTTTNDICAPGFSQTNCYRGICGNNSIKVILHSQSPGIMTVSAENSGASTNEYSVNYPVGSALCGGSTPPYNIPDDVNVNACPSVGGNTSPVQLLTVPVAC